MHYTWDEAKSDANLRSRHFAFSFATLVFDSPWVETEDRRRNYGEKRMIAVGLADGVHLTVVYTDRTAPDGQTVRRIISARKSNQHERQAYADRLRS